MEIAQHHRFQLQCPDNAMLSIPVLEDIMSGVLLVVDKCIHPGVGTPIFGHGSEVPR